jgi:hypothetical protein
MNELIFRVQVSNETPHYIVTIRRDKKNLTALCTCEQGGDHTLCKHRLSILSGKAKWVISDNTADVRQVLSWVAWTDVGQAIAKVVHAQKQLKDAEKELAKATERMQSATEEAELARQRLIQVMND